MSTNVENITPAMLTVLVSNVVICVVAVIAMITEKYKDTLLQCIGLSGMVVSAFVTSLQIIFNGQCTPAAIASLHTSVALYGAASVMKYVRRHKQ